jgi:hypothetical protein
VTAPTPVALRPAGPEPGCPLIRLGRERGDRPEAARPAPRRAPLAARLDAGESIKALSEYLGHSDPGFTLRTYTHLMPSSDERTRTAVDAVLGVQGVYTEGTDEAKPQVTGE